MSLDDVQAAREQAIGDLALKFRGPDPKERALARGERRSSRQRAGTKRWQQIAEAKQGPCRVCGAPGPNQLHHIVSRAQLGADTESNISPLCAVDHAAVTRREAAACRALIESLTDEEYSYAVTKGGEDFFERAYGLTYERGGGA